MSYTSTATDTYSVADIEIIMRRVTADLIMIASSTKAISEQKARDWGHDIELLAKNDYLKKVDLTLLSFGVEQKATCFEVSTTPGELVMSRPGGVLWPQVPSPELRIVLWYTATYDDAAKGKMAPKLNINWVPTTADTSHRTLTTNTCRDYVSNGYGMQRKDFSL
jgi:Bacterial HORMA domain family 1